MDWEKDTYAKGKQLNKWPFSEVISDANRFLTKWSKPRAPKVLEIGCGAGNNLWLFADLGFEVTGVDISKTAITAAREKLEKLNLRANLICQDISQNFNLSETFDLIIDRGTLCQIKFSDLISLIPKLFETMESSAYLYSYTLYGNNHPEKMFGREIENNTFDFFTDGYFQNVGQTTFFDDNLIKELFKKFDSLDIIRITSDIPYFGLFSEEYKVIATKK
jgi:SAM-dependent methyltransferase